MKTPNQRIIALAPTRLVAGVLMVVGSATTANAQALNPQISVRPVTPQELKDYSLTGVQTASGLTGVAIGNPAYLDALVNISFPNANITSVTWELAGKPFSSAAALTNSPLGANVPPYKMADRLTTKVAGRTMLIPDLEGAYSVKVTIVTTTSTTNLTQTIIGGKYLGVNNGCALCHSGGIIAPDKYSEWIETKHAHAFEEAIDGKSTDHFNPNCIKCHVVGFDANTNSANGGFDDVAAKTGWTFPPTLTNGNWDAMPAALKNVANVQCENCHGPGSQHAYSLGDPSMIAVTFAQGNCAQCHDSLSHHYRATEWNNSRHAVSTRSPSGPNRAACARCHTASGFAAYAETVGTTNAWTGTNVAYTVYEAITCATCHDPHDASNPHQLRAQPTIELADGPAVATVTNAGTGTLCMNCHQSRSGSYTNSLERYPLGLPTYAGGSSSFGPHDNPAADMLMGVNGYTYGKVIPSSAHRFAVTNTCAGCHMQEVASSDPAFTKAGGHTFSMVGNVVANGVTNTIEMVEVCIKCHGEMESFNLVKSDYNGDGVIEGVQEEVQKLLNRLSTMLPSSTYVADGNYQAAGVVQTRISVKTNWPAKFLQGAWNWQLVNNDLSKGIHNSKYAVGLLRASMADLSGDSNSDGIADAWQEQYFGPDWINDPNAGRNASPANDGVPNWLKFTLGLDPHVVGVVVPGGVVWANSKTIGGGDNAIQIYTAAEVVFNTEVGKKYQIQAASELSGGFQNVGDLIDGTGNSVSYVTPTRENVQQFYRVISTP